MPSENRDFQIQFVFNHKYKAYVKILKLNHYKEIKFKNSAELHFA